MTPPKLSDDDKQAAVDLYRLPDETTTSIASRYGVSPTTISRILKAGLPDDEYEVLMQQKRSLRGATPLMASPMAEGIDGVDGGIANHANDHELSISQELLTDPTMDNVDEPMTDDEILSQRRKRRRSSAPTSAPETLAHDDESSELSFLENRDDMEDSLLVSDVLGELPAVVEDDFFESPDDMEIGEDVGIDGDLESALEADDADEDQGDDSDDADDADDDQFDDDFEDDDLADADGGLRGIILRRSPDATVQVLPLSEAVLPRTLYLVIDRTSDLVTHPLKDFGDLGRIPTSEIQETTLPIFDNHRVARRFSKKNQKVVKIPDGNLLTKTAVHLQSKGITRLLIDGQVYSI